MQVDQKQTLKQNLSVYKSNSFVEASYSMSLDEMRVLSLTLGVFDPTNPVLGFHLTVSDFCKYFPDVDEKSAYAQVQNAIKKISSRWMTLHDDEKVKHEVAFITDRSYFKKEGRFYIEFHHKLLPYIANLKRRYTEYGLEYISRFKSTYSIRLYELLAQFRQTGWRIVSLEELKNWLLIENKYERWDALKQWVIKPAIDEINKKSDLAVFIEPIKKGRKIVALKFVIADRDVVLGKKKRPRFPHKNKYGKYVTFNADNPGMSPAAYGDYARDCLKILEDHYSELKDVTLNDLVYYSKFLAAGMLRSKLGKRSDFQEELARRGYKLVKYELVKLEK